MGATPLSALFIVENPEEHSGLPETSVSLSAPIQHPTALTPSPASSPSPTLTPTLAQVRVPSPLNQDQDPIPRARHLWDWLSSTALSAVQDVYGTPHDGRLSASAGAGNGGSGGLLGELQDWSTSSPRRASPSANAASTLTTLPHDSSHRP